MECPNTAPASSYPAPADGTLPRPAADGDFGRTFFGPKLSRVCRMFIAYLRSFVIRVTRKGTSRYERGTHWSEPENTTEKDSSLSKKTSTYPGHSAGQRLHATIVNILRRSNTYQLLSQIYRWQCQCICTTYIRY